MVNKQRRKVDPIDTIIECIEVFNEAGYEDSEVSDHELLLAKRRFSYALRYVIHSTVEQMTGVAYEKEQIQSDSQQSADA